MSLPIVRCASADLLPDAATSPPFGSSHASACRVHRLRGDADDILASEHAVPTRPQSVGSSVSTRIHGGRSSAIPSSCGYRPTFAYYGGRSGARV
jgi:hypothetical protein